MNNLSRLPPYNVLSIMITRQLFSAHTSIVKISFFHHLKINSCGAHKHSNFTAQENIGPPGYDCSPSAYPIMKSRFLLQVCKFGGNKENQTSRRLSIMSSDPRLKPDHSSSDYAPYPKLDPKDTAPVPPTWTASASTMPAGSNPYVSPAPAPGPGSSVKSEHFFCYLCRSLF